MKTTIRFIIVVLFCGTAVYPTFSQTEPNWMKSNKRFYLDKVINMEYSHPTGFMGDSLMIGLDWDYSEINLTSKDGSFLVCLSLYNTFNTDFKHTDRAKNIVELCYGKEADWGDYVQYYPQQYAKSKFNADTVISITLTYKIHEDFNYESDKYYFNRINGKLNSNYNHGKVFIIQKEERKFITMYCFYNEKAKKSLDAYMAAIEGTLKFRDSEPESKEYIIDGDLIVIGIYRKPPKGLNGN